MRYPILNLAITTFCSMACPDCHIDIPRRKDKQHYPWSYFEEAAWHLAGHFRCITLTGGEPSLHPQFAAFAPRIRALFQPERLHVESNGYGLTKCPEAFAEFDEVAITIYQADSFPGCPDNGEKIEFYRRWLVGHGKRNNLITGKTVFTPRSARPGHKPCNRLGIMAYYDGKLYPCCAGPGLPEQVHIPLSGDWQNQIARTLAPCTNCFFALP